MTAQPFYTSAAAIAASDGTATFSFPATAGQAWYVTVSVPGGIQGSFDMTQAGVDLGSWQGDQGIGPLLILPQGPLAVDATNLTPTLPYTCILQGSVGQATDFAGTAPTPSSATVQATRTQQFVTSGILAPQGQSGSILSIDVQLSANWRSLYVGDKFGRFNTIGAQMLVFGNQSGMVYDQVVAQFMPKGTISFAPAFVRVPLAAGVDTSVSVAMTNFEVETNTWWIGADNDPTDMSIDASASAPLDVLTIITSPLRGAYGLPANSQIAQVTSGGASGTLIAAPGVGSSILLGSLMCFPGTGAPASASVSATVAGVTAQLVSSTQATATVDRLIDRAIWPTGVLCDDNKAVTWAASIAGANSTFLATYDIIVSP